MNAKLTLRLDEDLIEAAKRYAARSGKSVSKLVEDYFAVLPETTDTPAANAPGEVELTPRVKALYGAYPEDTDPRDTWHQHLEEKYR